MSTDDPISDLLKIPVGLISFGDPIDGNPFDLGDRHHDAWKDATHRAEEELCRFNFELAKIRVDGPNSGLAYMCGLVVGKFDIWAKRAIQVVWSAAEARPYSHWLVNYADACLREVSVRDCFSLVLNRDRLLSELRLRLIERIEWWKAEALRYISEQEVHLADVGRAPNAAASRSTDKSRTAERPQDVNREVNLKTRFPLPDKPLPPAIADFSNLMDGARLTEKQRKCYSLKWEYGLKEADIALRLNISRTAVYDRLAAGQKRVNEYDANRRAHKAAARRPQE